MGENNFLAQPNYHWDILTFFLKELKLNRKYVLLECLSEGGKLPKMLAKHIHLFVSIIENGYKNNFLKQQFAQTSNVSFYQNTAFLEDDSVDFALLGQYFYQIDKEGLKKELSRVLRLNSFVCVLIQELKNDNPFSDAYFQLLSQYKVKDNYHAQEEQAANKILADFFPNGFETKQFSSQLRLNKELLVFYQENLFADQPKHITFNRALNLIFNQHQQHDEIVLNFETKVYFGIYNKYTPAISLQKSIFFSLLKPFAFSFYVLVKLNVYFWRFLYKLKFLSSKK
jgi:hypothetical protein